MSQKVEIWKKIKASLYFKSEHIGNQKQMTRNILMPSVANVQSVSACKNKVILPTGCTT
jgi:hypothetical protein